MAFIVPVHIGGDRGLLVPEEWCEHVQGRKVNPKATLDFSSDPLPDLDASDAESKFQILDLKGSPTSLFPALALLVACAVALHAVALVSQRLRKHRIWEVGEVWDIR